MGVYEYVYRNGIRSQMGILKDAFRSGSEKHVKNKFELFINVSIQPLCHG